jgi:hypothetical protein
LENTRIEDEEERFLRSGSAYLNSITPRAKVTAGGLN